MKKHIKWLYAVLVLLLLIVFGFTFSVREGTSCIVTSFGKIRDVYRESGLKWKLPWPFEKVITLDTRSQCMDSGYTETLTQDKKNIILQTYMIWHIEDETVFYNSIGSMETAETYLNDLLANAKNGVMGMYPLTALTSTNAEDIKLEEIEQAIFDNVAEKALVNYGICVENVKVKRLALPETNIQSVFSQMMAERQKYVTQLQSEGARDAAIIRSNADSEAAQIIADAQKQVAEINTETQRMVMEIYADAYMKNPELFTFLRQLTALESSVSENTVLVMTEGESPFGILTGMEEALSDTGELLTEGEEP